MSGSNLAATNHLPALSPPPAPQLADQHSGRRVRAVFKPRVPGDADGWHRAPIEWVAYELNLLLGMDYVPPVAYRCAVCEYLFSPIVFLSYRRWACTTCGHWCGGIVS